MQRLQGDVRIASFQVKPDTIALLRTSQFDEALLFGSAEPAILSVVAFAYALPPCAALHRNACM